jgi:cytochrome c biogenesis protein CcmG/thiol:disulfide interchange protein DsbE
VQKRLFYLLPLAVFMAMAVYFAIGLTKDSSILPSVLIDKSVPDFALPPIEGGPGKGFSNVDLKSRDAGKGEPTKANKGVSVVNVFASWCVPCRVEHPVIMRLAELKVAKLYGLNYKDDPKAALKWLADLGDPYTAHGADTKGRVAIDFGVYGIPETFIIDATGTIRYKYVGPISAERLEDEILPIIKKLSQ